MQGQCSTSHRQVIDWTNEPNREGIMRREIMALDALYPFSNLGPEQYSTLVRAWSVDLREFRIAEIVLAIGRWRTDGKSNFPVPADITRMIRENRANQTHPEPNQPALESTRGLKGGPISTAIQGYIDQGMSLLDAMPLGLADCGYVRNQVTGRMEKPEGLV